MVTENLGKETKVSRSIMHTNHDISFSGLTRSLINQHVTSLNADNKTINCTEHDRGRVRYSVFIIFNKI
jgi:tRNA A37 threonylcarbamoyltransferase TsaD